MPKSIEIRLKNNYFGKILFSGLCNSFKKNRKIENNSRTRNFSIFLKGVYNNKIYKNLYKI